MTSITHTSFYNITCKVCDVIRKAIVAVFATIMIFAENAGRARAANELAQRGMYEQAKALMLKKDKEDVS